jgi:MraZ protein
MLPLFGEFHCAVDNKGRLRLPSGLKSKIGAGEQSFVLKRGFEGCLELWPEANWLEHSSQIMAGLDNFNAEDREFRRSYFGGIANVESDSAERILIPKFLMEAIEIANEVSIQGAGDKFEIFPAKNYEEKYATPSDDFQEKAARVMKRATKRVEKPQFNINIESAKDEVAHT